MLGCACERARELWMQMSRRSQAGPADQPKSRHHAPQVVPSPRPPTGHLTEPLLRRFLDVLPTPVIVVTPVRDTRGSIVDLTLLLANAASSSPAWRPSGGPDTMSLAEALLTIDRRRLLDACEASIRARRPTRTRLGFTDADGRRGTYAVQCAPLDDVVVVSWCEATDTASGRGHCLPPGGA